MDALQVYTLSLSKFEDSLKWQLFAKGRIDATVEKMLDEEYSFLVTLPMSENKVKDLCTFLNECYGYTTSNP